MSFTVAVSAGHHPGKSGACLEENICEYGEVMPLLAEIIRHLERAGISAHMVGTGYLQDKTEDIRALNPDCAIEVHLNSAPVVARGCETLHYPGSKEGKALARSIQSHIATISHNPDRGIKPGYFYEDGERAGKLYFLEEILCPSVIVEPWFIHHEPEMLDNRPRQQQIGQAIAKGVLNWR